MTGGLAISPWQSSSTEGPWCNSRGDNRTGTPSSSKIDTRETSRTLGNIHCADQNKAQLVDRQPRGSGLKTLVDVNVDTTKVIIAEQRDYVKNWWWTKNEKSEILYQASYHTELLDY